jgi:hypothetical protein
MYQSALHWMKRSSLSPEDALTNSIKDNTTSANSRSLYCPGTIESKVDGIVVSRRIAASKTPIPEAPV